MNIKGGANSDDETSPGKDQDMQDSDYLDNKNLNQTNIKPKHNMAVPMGGGGLDIMALAGKLGEINDEEEAEKLKKEEFERKRKLHYKNEFMMAQKMRA